MESAIQIKHEIDSLCKDVQKLNIFNTRGLPSYSSAIRLQNLQMLLNHKISTFYKKIEFEFDELAYAKKDVKLNHEVIKKVLEKNLGSNVFIRYNRVRHFSEKRQIALYFLNKYTNLTLKQIGQFFEPKFDHTTVIHGITVFKNLVEIEPHIRRYATEITKQIESHVDYKLEQLRSLADAEVRQHNANTAESIPY